MEEKEENEKSVICTLFVDTLITFAALLLLLTIIFLVIAFLVLFYLTSALWFCIFCGLFLLTGIFTYIANIEEYNKNKIPKIKEVKKKKKLKYPKNSDICLSKFYTNSLGKVRSTTKGHVINEDSILKGNSLILYGDTDEIIEIDSEYSVFENYEDRKVKKNGFNKKM